MNNSKKLCEICSLSEHKYKCPKCKVVYCSLNCYKTHKESCIPSAVERPVELEEETVKPTTSKESVVVKSDDSVNQERFSLLGQSEELKKILSNAHLRDLLKTINEASEKSVDVQMDKAMQEPLFTEFADACLRIVQDQSELELPGSSDGVVKIEDLMRDS